MTIGKLFQKDKKDSDRKSVAERERESEAKRTQSNVDIPYRDGWNWNLCHVFFSTFFIKSLLSSAFYLFAFADCHPFTTYSFYNNKKLHSAEEKGVGMDNTFFYSFCLQQK